MRFQSTGITHVLKLHESFVTQLRTLTVATQSGIERLPFIKFLQAIISTKHGVGSYHQDENNTCQGGQPLNEVTEIANLPPRHHHRPGLLQQPADDDERIANAPPELLEEATDLSGDPAEVEEPGNELLEFPPPVADAIHQIPERSSPAAMVSIATRR